MVDIQVSKISEVYLQVNAQQHIIEEISNYFTFYVPGYQFNPLFKKRRTDGRRIWDGKIKLFHMDTHLLPTGLIRYLMNFAEKRKYAIEYQKGMHLLNNFSLQEAKEYIDLLKIHSNGEPLEARDYQIESIAKSIRYKRSLLVSPTASGKSFMIYVIMCWLLSHGLRRGLIIVPTTSLVEQMYKDFTDYATPAGPVPVPKFCQKIYSGFTKTITKPVTISTWQSIFEMPAEFFEQFDFVIGDEAHTFQAKSLSYIMKNLVCAQYRIGTTGTLNDMKVHKLSIEGWFGPECTVTTTKKLMDKGYIAPFKVKCLTLKHTPESCEWAREFRVSPDESKGAKWRTEIDYLFASESRNNFLTNLVLSLNGNSLMLFQYVESHGQILYDLVLQKAKKNRKVYMVYGRTEVEQREDIRRITEHESDAIIVASYGVFSTGINIKSLQNIILASPTKSKIRVLQSIGRVLRLKKDGAHATVYDISDDLRSDGYVNRTFKHFTIRYELYRREDFDVTKYTIPLQ